MKYIQYVKTVKAKRDRGFTLIELLVVIIILAVLSAVAIPSFIRQTGKAREVDAKTRLGAISRSQQAYKNKKRK